MKAIYFLTLLVVFILGSLSVQAQNPYKEFGIEVEPLTLSKGKYNEFFTNDSLVRIGSVILDTRNNRIASFVIVDTAYSEATLEPEVSSRFLSPDPHAANYPNVSPYVYALNNPIVYNDPDGRDVCCLDFFRKVKEMVAGAREDVSNMISMRNTSFQGFERMSVEEKEAVLARKQMGDMAAYALQKSAEYNEGIVDGLRIVPGMDAALTAYEGDYGEAALKAGAEFLLPVGGLKALKIVSSADSKIASVLSKFDIDMNDLSKMVNNVGEVYGDLGNNGNINIFVPRPDGNSGFIRVTLDPDKKRIISAGLNKEKDVINGIESGRFVQINN